MKTELLLLFALLINLVSIAQNVNIPDANLKSRLVNNYNLNTNQDSEIQTTEASAYTGMIQLTSVYGIINDYTGLEAFTEITILTFSSVTNNLQSIDLSSNTMLEELYISDSNIQTVDVSALIALKKLHITGSSGLTSIDLSNNTALENLNFSPFGSSVTSLDVSNLSNLKTLKVNSRTNNSPIANSSITSILFGTSHPLLTKAELYRNNLQTIDVSNLTSLTYLNLSENALTSLDVNSNNSLELLSVSDNNLQVLSTMLNTNLQNLSVSNNLNLTPINLSTNTDLNYLYIGKNNFTALNLASNINLNSLTIDGNLGLNTIDVSNNVNLEYFEMYSNTEVTDVDLSNNIQLLEVYINENSGLISINVANGNNGVSYTSLYYVNVTYNSNLTCIQHDVGFDPTLSSTWTKDGAASWSTNCVFLSVNDFNSNKVEIYPNPVSSILNINSDKNIKTLEIHSVLGEKIKEKQNTKSINMSTLKNGAYMIKLYGENGSFITKKIIKE